MHLSDTCFACSVQVFLLLIDSFYFTYSNTDCNLEKFHLAAFFSKFMPPVSVMVVCYQGLCLCRIYVIFFSILQNVLDSVVLRC